MLLADLLAYIVLFFVAFAVGCAHGMKCDIADQRKAMAEEALHRAA